MEAGTAPQAPQTQGDAPAAEGTQQGPDFSAVLDRIDGIEGSMAPVVEWVQSQQQANQPQEQSYEDFVAGLFSGDSQQQGENAPQYDAYGNPAAPQQQQQTPAFLQDPQAFTSLLDRAVDRRLQESVTPELQALREERFQRDVSGLLERIPALNDVKVAQETTLAAQQFSHELAQRLGHPDLADELWRMPGVVENIYLANQARQRSDAEVPADASGNEARLEGGGANPGQPEGPGLAQQIIQAHRGSQPDGSNGVSWW